MIATQLSKVWGGRQTKWRNPKETIMTKAIDLATSTRP